MGDQSRYWPWFIKPNVVPPQKPPVVDPNGTGGQTPPEQPKSE